MVMRTLSIDTTSMRGSVALTEGDVAVVEYQNSTPQTHAENLLSTVDRALSEAGWEKGDLDAIACALGPGSFTGLRIGLAAAKGIAFSLDIPIAGVSSLKSLAMNRIDDGKFIVPIIDARRSEVYSAAYRFSSGKLEEVIEECVLPPDVLIEKLLECDSETILVAGGGVLEYQNLFETRLNNRIDIPEEKKILPCASNLARLCLEKLENGGDDLIELVPNYIRRSDAEIGFLGKGGK